MHCIARNTPTTQIVYLKLEKKARDIPNAIVIVGEPFSFFLFSFSHCFSFLFLLLLLALFLLFLCLVWVLCVCVFLFDYLVFIIFRLNLWLVFLRVVWPCHMCFSDPTRSALSLSLSLPLSYFSLFVYAFSVLQLIASFYLRAFGKLKRPRKTKPKLEYFYSIWRHKLPLTLSLGSRRPFWSFSKERTYRFSPPPHPIEIIISPPLHCCFN